MRRFEYCYADPRHYEPEAEALDWVEYDPSESENIRTTHFHVSSSAEFALYTMLKDHKWTSHPPEDAMSVDLGYVQSALYVQGPIHFLYKAVGGRPIREETFQSGDFSTWSPAEQREVMYEVCTAGKGVQWFCGATKIPAFNKALPDCAGAYHQHTCSVSVPAGKQAMIMARNVKSNIDNGCWVLFSDEGIDFTMTKGEALIIQEA